MEGFDATHAHTRTAFITGITGQDGSYLAELLLEKGYNIHGLARRDASQEGVNAGNIRNVGDKITIHKGDITDPHGLAKTLGDISPDEIYHLAAQSHVSQSFATPSYTMQVNALGTLNLLQAIVSCGLQAKVRLYNASTSELFGGSDDPSILLNEQSLFAPRSPYAISKQAAHWLVRNYRESQGLWAVNGILFNHESARRGSGFVTMRIARGVAARVLSRTDMPLTLAGVDMARDWGHSRDYVRGMWMMLQQNQPRDMVLATGKLRTVHEFAEAAFAHVGIQLRWHYNGDGTVTSASEEGTGSIVIQIDRSLERPREVRYLAGDSSLAKEQMGWESTIPFETLVAEMVDAEIRRLKDH